ncbi:MAG TPA: cold shock domain-containing protein [Asanoa sp.]|nr:cold shock domain-containing protein [Asanoa sp.]
MAYGTVKFFNAEKAYGFITPDDGGPDVFLNVNSIQGSGYRTLAADQQVEFDLKPNTPRPTAINVRVM